MHCGREKWNFVHVLASDAMARYTASAAGLRRVRNPNCRYYMCRRSKALCLGVGKPVPRELQRIWNQCDVMTT